MKRLRSCVSLIRNQIQEEREGERRDGWMDGEESKSSIGQKAMQQLPPWSQVALIVVAVDLEEGGADIWKEELVNDGEGS